MRFVRRLTDFRSDFRDSISLWLLLLFRCRFHSSLSAYRLFEIALRQHQYSRAELICGHALRRYGECEDVRSMLCILAFKAGDLERGFSLFDHCVSTGDFRALERLLFRTGSRPADMHQRLLVLDRIGTHQDVLFSHRCYARIAQGYQVLQLEDFDLAANLVSPLRILIDQLESDPSVGYCEASNRRSRGKMLVSLCTVCYHLALLLEDDGLLEFAWLVAGRFLEGIDFRRFNADAGLRMSSNLSRCLAIGLLLPVSSRDERLKKILMDLAALDASVIRHWLPAQAGRRYATQENHLVLMAELQADLKTCLGLHQSVSGEVFGHLSRLLNHSSSKSLNKVIERRLQGVMRS